PSSHTLSLHDALPISKEKRDRRPVIRTGQHKSGPDEIKRAVAESVGSIAEELAPAKDATGWKLPKLSLLTSFKASEPDQADLERSEEHTSELQSRENL